MQVLKKMHTEIFIDGFCLVPWESQQFPGLSSVSLCRR